MQNFLCRICLVKETEMQIKHTLRLCLHRLLTLQNHAVLELPR